PPAVPGPPGKDVLLPHEDERAAVSETTGGIAPDDTYVSLVSLRTRRWKLIHTPTLGRYELYDLVRDPGEQDDRYETAAEAAALAEQLAGWRATTAPPPYPEGADPGLRGSATSTDRARRSG